MGKSIDAESAPVDAATLVAVGRAVSRKHAMEMALTGRLYSAEEAERFGLVNRVVPEGRALDEAFALARTISSHSAPTLAIGKRAFYLQDGQWVDAEDAGKRKTRVVKLLSPEYFALLKKDDTFAKAQQLGWALSINVGEERIVVEKDGKQKDDSLIPKPDANERVPGPGGLNQNRGEGLGQNQQIPDRFRNLRDRDR